MGGFCLDYAEWGLQCIWQQNTVYASECWMGIALLVAPGVSAQAVLFDAKLLGNSYRFAGTEQVQKE